MRIAIEIMTETPDEFDAKFGIIDSETPPHTDLSAIYKRSFAYYTFRVRLPSTLNAIITGLVKDRNEHEHKYCGDAGVEIDKCTKAIGELHDNVLDNGKLLPFSDAESDAELWNEFIAKLPEDKCSYFSACWLYAECYIYRKLSSIFNLTSTLASFDYFRLQKQTALVLGVDAMVAVVQATRQSNGEQQSNQEDFCKLLKLNLWGNRCDLSITSGKQIKLTGDAFDQVSELDANLLVDSTADIWQCITSSSGGIVDIICDNSGYEIFTDFLVAEHIIDNGLANIVRFHVKAIPWFISDVTEHDFRWTQEFLSSHSNPELSAFGRKLQILTEEGKFQLVPLEHFWTSPYEFYRMNSVNPKLYQTLQKSKLIIFKGDLNYRKLVGDFSWPSTESFETCLRGFHPSNLCTLRTIKADLICGLLPGTAEELFAKDDQWMLTGDYGVIQFASRNN